MIPLLLCALHIAKSLYSIGEKGIRGFDCISEKPQMHFHWQRPFEEEALKVQRGAEGPRIVGFGGGNGFGRDR